MLKIQDICASAPIVPVLTIHEVEDGVPLAQALVAGGLPVLEVTLRTEAALNAMGAISKACPDAIVGAGTIRSPEHVEQCINAGAQFGVSPGSPRILVDAIERQNFPFLPGCASPTEAMELANRGFTYLKFFPAEAAGGVAMLKSMASPLPDIKFCPTGGIGLDNARDYLALPNVVTIGGSWVASDLLIKQKRWDEIEALARSAVSTLRML